jgi:hypothetical protein
VFKQPIGDAVTSIRVAVFNTAGSITDAFKRLPNWPLIGMGITLALGYLFGHYAQVSWQRLKFWGHHETTAPIFRGGPPVYQPPQTVSTPSPTTPAPVPIVNPEDQKT